MAKELPYFQFEPAEYLTKDISFCTLSAQGLFINICAFYWQRQCKLNKEQFLRRFNYVKEFEELIKEGIIDLDNEEIKIKFLDIQYNKATEFAKEQSRKGSLGGRPKKPNESQIKAEEKPNESQTKAIREDKIIEDNRREEKIIEDEIRKNDIKNREIQFAEKLKPFLDEYGKDMLNDFYLYWTEPNNTGKKMKFELQKTFDISRRLIRWSTNSFNQTKKQEPKTQEYHPR